MPAESYEAKTIEHAINMLAASARFREICGVSTSAAAKARIAESDGGTPESLNGQTGKAKATDGTTFDLTPPYALVFSAEPLRREWAGPGEFEYRYTIGINLFLPLRRSSETPAQGVRRALNDAGTIVDELNATTGYLAVFTASLDGLVKDDEQGPWRAQVAEITITGEG